MNRDSMPANAQDAHGPDSEYHPIMRRRGDENIEEDGEQAGPDASGRGGQLGLLDGEPDKWEFDKQNFVESFTSESQESILSDKHISAEQRERRTMNTV